jgi:hypothetical protein
MIKHYLIDANMIFSKLDSLGSNRKDILVLDDIKVEIAPSEERIVKLEKAGVRFICLNKKHYEKLKLVLAEHGENTDLIRLYTNEGVGDVLLIAYALAERENQHSLIEFEYLLVTNDKAVIDVAEKYNIECLHEIPSKHSSK